MTEPGPPLPWPELLDLWLDGGRRPKKEPVRDFLSAYETLVGIFSCYSFLTESPAPPPFSLPAYSNPCPLSYLLNPSPPPPPLEEGPPLLCLALELPNTASIMLDVRRPILLFLAGDCSFYCPPPLMVFGIIFNPITFPRVVFSKGKNLLIIDTCDLILS